MDTLGRATKGITWLAFGNTISDNSGRATPMRTNPGRIEHLGENMDVKGTVQRDLKGVKSGINR